MRGARFEFFSSRGMTKIDTPGAARCSHFNPFLKYFGKELEAVVATFPWQQNPQNHSASKNLSWHVLREMPKDVLAGLHLCLLGKFDNRKTLG